MKAKHLWLIVFLSAVCLISWQPTSYASERKKEIYEITFMSPEFGTPAYNMGAALEMLFEKHKSWVRIKHQETPGGTYIAKYMFQNLNKIKAGDLNNIIGLSSGAIFGHVIEGRPPLKKIALGEGYKAICSAPAIMSLYATFDPNLRSTHDFAGKRVGTAQKSRPFQGVLKDKPYFGKGLGIYNQIKWQRLGFRGVKDAFLNNQIDVISLNFTGQVEEMADGTLVCSKMAPGPSTMQVLNSGRKVYLIEYDPEAIRRGYDFNKDLIIYPIRIKKNAYKGIQRDMWGRGALGVIAGTAYIPDDAIEEFIRVVWTYREELGNFHADLKYIPENPYPIGIPKREWIHPGVIKAMHKLGFPIPQNAK